jgi:hypothetical protein
MALKGKRFGGALRSISNLLRWLFKNLASKSDYLSLFLVCLFPIQVWGLVNLFYNVPSLVLEMKAWEFAGVISYVFSFALFESLVVFGLVFILSLIVPRRYFSDRLLATGSVLIFFATVATVMNHLHYVWKIPSSQLDSWTWKWAAASLAATGITLWGMWRSEKLSLIIRSGAERLGVLSTFYLAVDLIGVLIVVVRNVV